MGVNFSGTSIDQCVEKASLNLNISKELIRYKVIKEERRFFKKIFEIEIIEDDKKESEKIQENKAQEDNSIIEKTILKAGIKIENGKIIVKNFEDKDESITIKPCDGIRLVVNGKQCDYITPVTEDDKIEYKFEEKVAQRNINISISQDNMEAYLTLKYIPENLFKLEDVEYTKNLSLKKVKVSEKYPPKYTLDEIEDVLKSKGIRYGIIKDQLKNICNEYNINNELIAEGKKTKDDIEDEIKFFFEDSNEIINYDSMETIDYRNRYCIANVKIGDSIAQIIKGKEGQDGIDIFGKAVKRKTYQTKVIKAGEGCEYKDNKIIAISEGRPSKKGNTFFVHKLYKTEDVNLASGNINFVGDVEVSGTVTEGMEVKAGNELFVAKNVESARVQAGGTINIDGNTINSKVFAGGENLETKQYLQCLQEYKIVINQLVESSEQIINNKLLGDRKLGEIIKILIENKFKSIDKLSKNIVNYNLIKEIKETPIIKFIKRKLIGFGPTDIQEISELYSFLVRIDEEIDEIDNFILEASDVYTEYCQNCTIKASGNIIITGKGQYTSKLTALKNIEFTYDNAVCRGGELSAGNEIKLKTVGSSAGISTILRVPKNGIITAEIAYGNTMFCFGERQMLLDISSKNVKAYMDKTGEIIIDKFIL